MKDVGPRRPGISEMSLVEFWDSNKLLWKWDTALCNAGKKLKLFPSIITYYSELQFIVKDKHRYELVWLLFYVLGMLMGQFFSRTQE